MSVGGVLQVSARIAAIEARVAATARAAGMTGLAGGSSLGVGGVGASPASPFAATLTRAVSAPDTLTPPGTVPMHPSTSSERWVQLQRHTGANAPSTAEGTVGAWVQGLPEAGRRWAGEIEAAARQAGVDPRLLAALVWAESGFRADARSHAGAIGLAQLMPGTAAGLGVNPHDPAQNLLGGARYLRAQLDRFGDPALALAAYNAGPGRVAQAGGVPAIPETRAYVPRVLGHYRQLGGNA